MDKYNFFTFSIKFSLAKNHSFSVNYKLLQQCGILDEDYMHDDYPHYIDDDKRTLAHIAFVIQELEKAGNNSTLIAKLKSTLSEDYKNFIDCVVFGFQGTKEIAAAITEVMFLYELDDAVVEVIQKILEYNKESPSNFADDTVLDFDALYIAAADRALLIKNDAKLAIKLYGLAAVDWNFSYTSDDGKITSKYRLSEREHKKLESMLPIFFQISNGMLLADKACLSTLLTEKNDFVFYNSYEKIIHKVDIDNEFLILIADFFEQIEKRFETNRGANYTNRFIAFLIINIYEKYLISVLYLFFKESKETQALYTGGIFSKLIFLHDTEYAYLLKNLENCPEKRKMEKLFLFVSGIVLSKKILNCLRVRGDVQDSAYYTSLDTFGYMLDSSKKEQYGKFSVMNISYMNDPNEGIIFKRYLYGKEYDNLIERNRKNVTVPYVFLKCFTSKIDYLPMWEMYGKHAQGCCLVIDWKKTLEKSSEAEKSLYHVCYIEKNRHSYSIRAVDNPQIKSIQSLQRVFSELKKIARKVNAEDFPVFDEVLKELIYLFKDNSYSYEQEIRSLYIFKSVNKKFKHTEEEIPKLFIVPDYAVNIKEIILGPKVRDISTLIPYFQEQVQLMCKAIGTDFPRITHSDIDYR